MSDKFDEIEKKVISVIADIAGVPEIAVDLTTHLQRELDIDSLDYVEVIVDLEKVFKVSIFEDNAVTEITVAGIVKEVKTKLEQENKVYRDYTKLNLTPHKAARFAMWLFGKDYAKSGLGSMAFYETYLNDSDRLLCEDAVKTILEARDKEEGDK